MSTVLVETGPDSFAALIAGQVPPGAAALADSDIAPAPVLSMLAELSDRIGQNFAPNAWIIVEDGCLAGLISLVVVPEDRTVRIGYGVAPSYRGRGVASRATGHLLTLMREDSRVDAVLAETAVDNPASQHVLRINGFAEAGSRTDPEDGDLICWRASTA